MTKNVFLTSNTYFGRVKALDLPKRKGLYTSVEDMNQKMIDIWNKTVGLNDIVYHLGYFAHDPVSTSTVIEQLNGTIYFLPNGTDKTVPEILNLYEHIKMAGSPIIELVNKNAFITYYPMEVWAGINSYHLYGDDRIKTDLTKTQNRACVSFDTWGKPINVDDCIDIITEFNKNE